MTTIELMKKYGHHLQLCKVMQINKNLKCDCGFEPAIAELEKQPDLEAENKRQLQVIGEVAIERDKVRAENKRLKKAILDFGNNPAGFDWAILERIEDLATEKKRLKDVLNLILNENFSGQSTLSPYVKRQAEQALREKTND